MSLIVASHDSLPYIDKPLTESQTAAAHALIASELSPSHSTTLHPSIPPLPPSNFTPALQSELARIASSLPISNGIDASRYENQQLTPDSDAPGEQLKNAYATSTHLSNRLTNLTLLSQFGTNGWLIGNSQLEGVLASLERELVGVKEETEGVNRDRKKRQVDVLEEMERLNRRFKEGVGRVLEVEVANEMVFREALVKRKEGVGKE